VKNVTVNFEDEFVERLDAFARDHHLKRNGAIKMVFEDYVGRKRWIAGHAVGYGEDAGGKESSNSQASPARAALASRVLELTQKRVGVHPVAVTSGGVEKLHDPDADVNLRSFYEKPEVVAQKKVTDWEEPP
jgi:predicted transcriptional regulator